MGFRRQDGVLAIPDQVKKIGDGMYALNNNEVYTCDSKTYDYSNSSAKAICFICGHCHYDANLYCDTNNTIPIISVTTDAYKRQEATYQDIDRTIGTYKEQAFDIIHLDLDNKNIIFKRIGAGQDREFSFE